MSPWTEFILFSSWKLFAVVAVLYLLIRLLLPKARRKVPDTTIACLCLVAVIGYFLLANPYMLGR